jgi:hypothetical protein
MKLDNQLPRCPAASSMKLPAPWNSAKNSRPGATTGIGMTKSLRNKQNMACVHKHIYIYTYVRTYVRYITLHYITVQYSTLHYVTLHYITYIHYIYIYIARPITFKKQYQGKHWPSVRMPKETDSPIPCNTGPYMASSHSLGEGLSSMPQLMDIAEQPFFRFQSLPQNQVV